MGAAARLFNISEAQLQWVLLYWFGAGCLESDLIASQLIF